MSSSYRKKELVEAFIAVMWFVQHVDIFHRQVNLWNMGRIMKGMGMVRGFALRIMLRFLQAWISHQTQSQIAKKIIPAFKAAYGAGYQGLFIIDNSQGHSAYAEDALCIGSHMNVKPGGKQAQIRNRWFVHNGVQVEQVMVFAVSHSKYLNQPKGIKVILSEHRLWKFNLHGKCSSKCKTGATESCDQCILQYKLNFQEQRPLIQEIIEAARHTCIFLPKFHCELNFIEFFWGRVKKYLHDNCDSSFESLKTNMPKALESVQVNTVWLWEHYMHRWIEAYRSGLPTKEAQLQVQQFSSMKYKSHRCIPETVVHVQNG